MLPLTRRVKTTTFKRTMKQPRRENMARICFFILLALTIAAIFYGG